MKRDRINIIKEFESLEANVWKCHRDLFYNYNDKCSQKLKIASYFDESELIKLTHNLKESKKIVVDYINENKELIDEYSKIANIIKKDNTKLTTEELLYVIKSEFVIKAHIRRENIFGNLQYDKWIVEVLLFDKVLYSFNIKNGHTQIEDTIINKFKKNERINRYR